jgi:hypothetical protein
MLPASGPLVSPVTTVSQPQPPHKGPRLQAMNAPVTAAAAAAMDARTLGEFVVLYSSSYQRQGWNKFIHGCRLPSDFATNVGQLPHRAAQLLDHLRRHGASVPFITAPWTQAKLDAARTRGSHKSATERPPT